MADEMVERLFVGGPLDGQRKQVHRGRVELPVPVVVPPVYVRGDILRDTSTPKVVYRLDKAPTGERAFLADGAQWNEHVDTEAWPRRIMPGHKTWERLAPWFWVGTGVDDTMDPPPTRLWRGDLRTYTMIDVTRSPSWLRLVQQVEERMIGDSIADIQETIARDFRHEIEYELLPTCPREGCEKKAISKLIVPNRPEPAFYSESLLSGPDRPREGLEHVEQLCGEHAYELRRQRYDVRTYREAT